MEDDELAYLRVPFDAEKRAELDRMAHEQRQREFAAMVELQRKHR